MAQVVRTGAVASLARRLYDKRDFKQALKEARVDHRKSATDETRRMLQQCCVARADELQRRGLAQECRQLIDELMTLQPVVDEVRDRLPELLVRAGLFERFSPQLGLDTVTNISAMLPVQVDLAVLGNARVAGEYRDEITAIRVALQALETGDAEAELKGLDVIPRSSPLADWKLFVRGLSAYYRTDEAAMKANWSRLEPQRKAAVLAKKLSALSDLANGNAVSADASRAVSQIEQAAVGHGLLSHLDNLKQILLGSDRRRILDSMRATLAILGQDSASMRNRLIELIAQQAIHASDAQLLERLIQSVAPPSYDPKWNRTWALLWERSEEGRGDLDPEELAEKHWRAFANDLSTLPSWSETDRRMAQSLVWSHLGELFAAWSSTTDEDEDEEFEEDRAEEEALRANVRQQARACFTTAQTLAPEILVPWQASVKACQKWKDQEGELAARMQLLEHFPEDFESLTAVADELVKQDRSLEALLFLERARRLKPLDEEVQARLWSTHLGAARQLAVLKKFEEGRNHLAEAERCDLTGQRRQQLLARRSIFERKAGDEEAAMRFDREACTLASEPAPVGLQLAAEAVRYELSKSMIAAYEADWLKQLSKKCNSQSAGLMAEYMTSYLKSRTLYDGVKKHALAVYDYVQRTSRVKFDREHLRSVCGFYGILNDHHTTWAPKVQQHLEQAAKRGVKQFPDDPFFMMILGTLEMLRGPNRARRKYAGDCLRKALSLAEQNPALTTPDLVNNIRAQLDMLEEFEEMNSGFDGGGFPFGFGPDMGEEFDEPFEFPFGPSGIFPTKGAPASPTFEEMAETLKMPASLRKMVEKVARQAGMSPIEILMQAANQLGVPGGPSSFDAPDLDDFPTFPKKGRRR